MLKRHAAWTIKLFTNWSWLNRDGLSLKVLLSNTCSFPTTLVVSCICSTAHTTRRSLVGGRADSAGNARQGNPSTLLHVHGINDIVPVGHMQTDAEESTTFTHTYGHDKCIPLSRARQRGESSLRYYNHKFLLFITSMSAVSFLNLMTTAQTHNTPKEHRRETHLLVPADAAAP